jgi:Cof subfamily protein (haloacid dehalogenase superfamily)
MTGVVRWERRVEELVAAYGVPRAVATDLDGTLLASDGTVSPRTEEALRAAVAVGVDVVFVTARPPRWVEHLAGMVGGQGVVLCANGAFIYDVSSRRVIAENLLPTDVARAIVADLQAQVPDVVFGFERRDGLALESRYSSDYPVPAEAVFGAAYDLCDPPPGKLLARSPSLASEDFLARVVEVIGDRAVVAFSGAVGLAEVSAVGVTKAAALDRWSRRRGLVAEQVWAFGDMPNDISMLSWAGVGVAVDNAHPDLHSVADLRAPSNDDDGVARIVESLVEIAVRTVD